MSGEKIFQKGLAKLNLSLSSVQMEQFERYYDLLITWNQRVNLTAITEYEDVVLKHFLDSLSLARVIPDPGGQTLLDLGTGAGFPGIPLKIAFPRLKVVLMDSLNKRVIFLEEVIRNLELCDIRTVHGRAEEMAGKKEYRQQFDLCVSRAVANLSTLAEYCLPFVRTGGLFVAYKSAEVDEEVRQAANAIRLLGGKTERIEKFFLPDSDLGRSLVCVRKIKNTPAVYPRKAGTPGKHPL